MGAAWSAMTKYNAVSGYTQSDEITLIWPACDVERGQLHPFAGRQQKMVSLVAAHVSVEFNRLLGRFKPTAPDDAWTATFDARLLVPESTNASILTDLVLWCSVGDCHRNAVHMHAMAHFSHRQLQKKSVVDMMATGQSPGVLAEAGVSFNARPMWERHGVLLKRRTVPVPAISEATCWRTQPYVFSMRLTTENSDFLLTKNGLPDGAVEDYPLSIDHLTR